MPTPASDESHDDFINRCIPIVLDEGTAEDNEQAYAICESIWNEKDKTMSDKRITKQVLNAPDLKAIDDDKRIIPFLASVKEVDRDGDIIDIATMDTSEFEKNPVINYAHDIFTHEATPIGKAVKLKKTKTYLKMWIKFVEPDIDPFAEKIYQLVKNGYLNAVSIGFIPSWEDIERPKDLKVNGRKVERIYKNTELYETSVVPVPSNRSALRTDKAFKDGLLDAEDMKLLGCEKQLPDVKNNYEERIKALEDRLELLETEKDLTTDDSEDSQFDDNFYEKLLTEDRAVKGHTEPDRETFFKEVLKEVKPEIDYNEVLKEIKE